MPTTRKRRSFKTTKQEYMMRHIRQWIDDHPTPNGIVDVDAMTQQFLDDKVWENTRSSKFRQCRQDVSQAMARDHIHDEELGEVRTMHAVRKELDDGQHTWEWAHGPSASPQHVALALQQRRNVARSRVLHMEVDRRYYNKSNKYGAEIPRPDYNFNKCSEEQSLVDSHGGEYPDEKPE